ncbi:MAG TPA: hypoxanthine phosphoribosyltransferase [Candidatus Saccharimonadales bacterium]|nr:hypoxanthine phosphoribosyltransferase [Candidatus Saccharimonadales bacterium]
MKFDLSRTEPVEPEAASGIRVMFTREQIARRVEEMGRQIGADYGDTCPLLVAVLKGAYVMMSDLSRAIPVAHEVDFLQAASYGGRTASSGQVKLIFDARSEIQGRHVLLVEGVVDSGLTLSFLMEQLRRREPASLKVATLLDKAPCRKLQVPLDYVGFRIGDEFVIGYGMDVAERYRNLPFVGIYTGA